MFHDNQNEFKSNESTLSELSFSFCFIYSAISSLLSEVKLSVDGKTATNNASSVLNLIVEAFKNNTKLNFTNADAFRASGEFIITIPKFAYKRNQNKTLKSTLTYIYICRN